MRFLLLLVLLTSSANAINKDQMNQLMDGEDVNAVMAKKPKKVVTTECSSSEQCKFDEFCHKASQYDAKGVCVKKPKD
jgi:hypothetical protein